MKVGKPRYQCWLCHLGEDLYRKRFGKLGVLDEIQTKVEK